MRHIQQTATEVWVVSPDKTLHRHLFDLVSVATVLRQICETISTNLRIYFDNIRGCFDNLSVRLGEVRFGKVKLGKDRLGKVRLG